MKNNFAVIFDMDGVIINSSKYNEKAFKAILHPYNVDLDKLNDTHKENFRGTSLVNMLNTIKEEYGIEFDFNTFSLKAGEIAFQLMV